MNHTIKSLCKKSIRDFLQNTEIIIGAYNLESKNQSLSDNVISNMKFHNCLLYNASFFSFSFNKVAFKNCIFYEFDFGGVNFQSCIFDNCWFVDSSEGLTLSSCKIVSVTFDSYEEKLVVDKFLSFTEDEGLVVLAKEREEENKNSNNIIGDNEVWGK